jgi:type IV pilus assembly protein PilB
VKAALTGHLVLSTLHTNDAPSTINRLLNMGVEPFLVASSINLIMAQRLVRVICQSCKEESPMTPEALVDIGAPSELAEQMVCYRGVGCPTCNGTGYKGRLALYEVMPMAEAIREAVISGASTAEVKRTAIQSGMCTLRRSGINKIADGVTTVEEVLRITMPDAQAG